MSAARIRIYYADGRTEERTLSPGRYVIGRESGDVVLRDPNVSGRHADLTVEPHRVLITDAGSKNGTWDPAERRIAAPLQLEPNRPVRLGGSGLMLVEQMPGVATPAFGLTPRSAEHPAFGPPQVPSFTSGLDAPPPTPNRISYVPAPRTQTQPQYATTAFAHAAYATVPGQPIGAVALSQRWRRSSRPPAHAPDLFDLLSAMIARAGVVALASAVAVWIAYFFLPALRASFFLAARSFTLADLVSIQFGTSAIIAVGSRGLGLLGVVALTLPFVVPFIKSPRGRLLHLAPLAFVSLAALRVWFHLNAVAEGAGGAASLAHAPRTPLAAVIGNTAAVAREAFFSAISVDYGAYVLALTTVVLASQAFFAPQRARRDPE